MEMSNQLHNPADFSRGKQRTLKFNYSEPDGCARQSWHDVMYSSGICLGRPRIKMKRINQALANPDPEVRSNRRYALPQNYPYARPELRIRIRHCNHGTQFRDRIYTVLKSDKPHNHPH